MAFIFRKKNEPAAEPAAALVKRIKELEAELIRERSGRAGDLAQLMQRSQDAIYRYELGTRRFSALSEKWLELLGVASADQVTADQVRRTVHPDDLERVRQAARESLRPDCEGGEIEYRQIMPGGERHWVQDHWVVVRDASGQAVAMEGILRNVTDRKKAEQALRESEERFRELAQMLPETIFEMDAGGRLTFVNERAYDQFGFTRREFEQGLNGFDMIADQDRERARRNARRVMRGEYLGLSEYVALRRDGSTFPALLCSTAVMRGATAQGFRGIVIDITETKRLESQFHQAQRLEAIGTLAGGIAHDFNNLLMGIQGRTSLLLMGADPSDERFGHLKEIEAYIENAADLTRQLLGFAREGKYEVTSTDLNRVVKRSAAMFGRTKKEIVIHEAYQPDLWPVESDRSQIEQVLLNIFVNAWQAMPGGGTLRIATANVTLEDTDARSSDSIPGRFVKISIGDSGIGMDQAIQSRLFDPFFTTKTMGRGTGLGLAAVYGIVNNHGGFIDVTSAEGQGSRFDVYLPAADTQPAAKEMLPQGDAPGDETILLVDDEDIIIDVAEGMLQRLGYTVLIARSGAEALELYRRHQDDIAVVLLDMIMPELSGRETCEQLLTINPRVKVILSSGYSLDGQAAEMLERGCLMFIQKPFDLKLSLIHI